MNNINLIIIVITVIIIVNIPSLQQAPINTTLIPLITISNQPTATLSPPSILSTNSPSIPPQATFITTQNNKGNVNTTIPTTTDVVKNVKLLNTLTTGLQSTSLFTNCTTNCSKNTNNTLITSKTKHKYHNYFILTIGVLSLLGLIINFVFMTRICSCNGVSVIVLFGICLMLFNILMALYGMTMSAYLYKSPLNWDQRFCQGLTSIKLFALGSGVWSLIMLSFHNAIRESTDTERDAVFKGVVYVLEGIMLSGVLAVMSWIKLDSWDHLCVFIKPETTVEWMLTGIEIWHYFIATLLVLRFPYYYCHLKKKIDEEILEKRTEEVPVFIIILISLMLWALGFSITLPYLGMFSYDVSAVIRLCTLLLVIIIQPLIYTIRGTFLCTCKHTKCCCKKTIKQSEKDVLLVCECSGSETCAACEPDYEVRTRYGDTLFTENIKNTSNDTNGKVKDGKKKKIEETKDVIRKSKKRKKGKITSPVCRSPEIRGKLESKSEISDEEEGREDDPLLDKVPEDKSKAEKERKQRKSDILELKPLLDDTDGTSNAPKAFPENSPLKTPDATIDSPRNRQTEFPSFINLKDVVNVDELPKEKKILHLDDLKKQSPIDERVSRGPTFYSIPDKDKKSEVVVKHPEKIEKIDKINDVQEKDVEPEVEKEKNTQNNVEKEQNTQHELKNDVKKRKKKKKSKHEKTVDSNSAKKSTESLEWDYSSGSSLSGDNSPTPEDSINAQNKDTNMEWDPSGFNIEQKVKGADKISPAPEWEPYSADEGRSSSVPSVMPRPIHHLSTDVSFEHTSGEVYTETAGGQVNGVSKSETDITAINDKDNNDSVTNEDKEEKVKSKKQKKEKKKKEKKKHKQENGKVKEKRKKKKQDDVVVV